MKYVHKEMHSVYASREKSPYVRKVNQKQIYSILTF